ncbi:MAG: c-type cytochrome, partial [Acidobacteriota bacterium]
MSKLKLYVCLLAVWFLLVTSFMLDEPIETSDQTRHSLSGDPVKGRHILASKGCLECHSMWGAGGKKGPDLAGVGMGKSMAEIAGSLWGHKPYATELTEQRGASLPIISPEEMSDLISYLYYLNYFNEPGDEI